MKRKYTLRQRFSENEMQRRLPKETKEIFDRLGTAALVAVVFGRDTDVLETLVEERNKYLLEDFRHESVQQHRDGISSISTSAIEDCFKISKESGLSD